MVNQIKKNAEDIEHRLEIIRQTNLFKPCPLNQLGELPRCKVRPTLFSWRRSRVGRTLVSAGELSLSYARLLE